MRNEDEANSRWVDTQVSEVTQRGRLASERVQARVNGNPLPIAEVEALRFAEATAKDRDLDLVIAWRR